MTEGKKYSSRSAAIRAARQHCCEIFGRAYEAHEGPDYEILPQGRVWNEGRVGFDYPHAYRLPPSVKEARD